MKTGKEEINFSSPSDLKHRICAFLEDHKISDIVDIDLKQKSSIADWMIIASGRSQKHIRVIAEMLQEELKAQGLKNICVEGLPNSDWLLVDAGDVIVHLFRPEMRALYNLEKMWGVELNPQRSLAAND